MLGNYDNYSKLTSENEWFITFIYIFCTLLLVIVILNLLISLMSNTFQNVLNINNMAYDKNRMKIIADIDNLQNEGKKRGFLITIFKNELKNDIKYDNQNENYFSILNDNIKQVKNI